MTLRFPKKELREAGFKEREIMKTTAFIEVVSRHFKDVPVLIDLCAGNGLCSFLFHYNGLVKRSIAVDVKMPLRFRRLNSLFNLYGFENEYIVSDIMSESFEFKSCESSLVVSIHPCSELGDRVIKFGLERSLPFAVMPCCYKTFERSQKYELKNPPDSRLLLYAEKEDYFDLVRIGHIREKGWTCFMEEVSKETTARNHVLIAKPPKNLNK